jgi:hypothetical protein
MEKPQPIDWPRVKIGGKEFTLRFAYSAYYQLAKWGKNIASADVLEMAAAAAGNFDPGGNWHSAGFSSPLDLADLIVGDEGDALLAALADALKKAAPGTETTVQPVPAKSEALT